LGWHSSGTCSIKKVLIKKQPIMLTENVKENLKDVIERNIDACKGYEKAAEKVENYQLAEKFRSQAAQRKKFAVELESAAHVLGPGSLDKIEEGSIEANLHRTWMDVKSIFSTDNEESMLEECIRGEKESLEEYDELIQSGLLTTELSTVVQKQRGTIQETIHDLQQLENQFD
jgi:uncharacterized protein (TIGR02284 family)